MKSETGLVAIDFGTSRTKVAYFDSATKRWELMRIGEDEKPYLPSVFYLADDGSRHFGDDALMLMKEDPLGFLDQPLKRSLRDSMIMTGNRQKTTPETLLQLLLTEILNRISQHPEFIDNPPSKISFTLPADSKLTDEDIIRRAAVNAGFEEKQISFVCEPVAAAKAWFMETKQQEEFIVVLDCGGGTLDWACLHQTSPGVFELIPELTPGCDQRIGGHDIDEALFTYVRQRAEADEDSYCRTNKAVILTRLQYIKEKYSRTKTAGVVRLRKQKIDLPQQDVEDIVVRRFVRQTIDAVKPFIDKVREMLKVDKPVLLLVGGSSRFPVLRKMIAEEIPCRPLVWERSEYATVLGASSKALVSNKKIPVPPEPDKPKKIEEETRKPNKQRLIDLYCYRCCSYLRNPSDSKHAKEFKEIQTELFPDNKSVHDFEKEVNKTIATGNEDVHSLAVLAHLYLDGIHIGRDLKKCFKYHGAAFNIDPEDYFVRVMYEITRDLLFSQIPPKYNNHY